VAEHEAANPTPRRGEHDELLARSQVSLWIDDYDDIFSDFDPSPYAQRALSDDFLAEAKKAVRDRPGGVPELRFLVPEAARNQGPEAMICKRLREHFRKHAEQLARERRRTVLRGLCIAITGFVLMMVSTFLRERGGGFWRTALNVLLEPSGWFAVWFGLDELFYGNRATAKEHAFYQKMAKTEIVFDAY
jgi:hypothetical protein